MLRDGLKFKSKKKEMGRIIPNYVHTSACEGLPRMLTTIMDKSLGTLQYFWAFSKSHRPNPSLHSTNNVRRAYEEFFPSFSFV